MHHKRKPQKMWKTRYQIKTHYSLKDGCQTVQYYTDILFHVIKCAKYEDDMVRNVNARFQSPICPITYADRLRLNQQTQPVDSKKKLCHWLSFFFVISLLYISFLTTNIATRKSFLLQRLEKHTI